MTGRFIGEITEDHVRERLVREKERERTPQATEELIQDCTRVHNLIGRPRQRGRWCSGRLIR